MNTVFFIFLKTYDFEIVNLIKMIAHLVTKHYILEKFKNDVPWHWYIVHYI